MNQSNNELSNLIATVKRLRDPQHGCPWDLKQTHQTLLKYLIEESHEFIIAVDSGDKQKMEEELGDVLLQVLLHSTIAEQAHTFDLNSVAKKLNEKLISRHPHVFAQNTQAKSAEEVEKKWKEIKIQEKGGEKPSSLMPEDIWQFPSLFAAYKIGKKTEEIYFDWENVNQVTYKVEEEWQELKEELSALPQINPQKVEEELGDLLFSIAQLSRHLKLNPEEVLLKANHKFLKRFKLMENLVRKSGKDISKMRSNHWEVFWQEAKNQLKENE